MAQTFIFRTTAIALTCALLMSVGVFTALAHNGETHETAAESDVHDVEQLEKIVYLMQQVIILLTTLRSLPASAAVPTTPAATEPHEHEHSETTTTATPVATLVIEVEEHHDDTHVHVRYVDKPEEMFFVDADMHDEAGLIADIVERTGLTSSEVGAALKYMGM
jgi:hypothetical protein